MATLTPVRQPFGELSTQRLQQLTSIKNRQNGLISTPNGKIKSPLSKVVTSSSSPPTTNKKRPAESTIFTDSDGENVDPSIFLSPSKKAKPSNPISIMASTTTPRTPLVRSIAPLRSPATAPAGRSPPRPRPTRRISAPYTRIDPPTSTSGGPFFSLSAALAGTKTRSTRASKGLNFTIHEDTPEQEAEILMEHSASILDLSSDDESRAKESRGKENVAPEGTERVRPRIEITRRKVGDGMDDGQRTPLSEVEREDFFPQGLKGDEVVIVAGDEAEKSAAADAAVPAEPEAVAKDDGEIVIYEDSE